MSRLKDEKQQSVMTRDLLVAFVPVRRQTFFSQCRQRLPGLGKKSNFSAIVRGSISMVMMRVPACVISLCGLDTLLYFAHYTKSSLVLFTGVLCLRTPDVGLALPADSFHDVEPQSGQQRLITTAVTVWIARLCFTSSLQIRRQPHFAVGPTRKI